VEFTQSSRANVHSWWPFVALLFAGASRWMVVTMHPAASSTLASEALGYAWAALLSFALIRLTNRAEGNRACSATLRIRSLFSGAMLFGGPAAPLLLHERAFDPASLTIALALTSIVIAIVSSALRAERSDGIAGRVWPGLAAVAGLLLLLAQPAPGDVRTDLALFLAPTLTGIGAALFCTDQAPSASRLPTALLGASLLFTLAFFVSFFLGGLRPSTSLLAIASDGVLALLEVMTLVRLGATRWSAQFTWIPLLIVLEGIALMRPQLTTYRIVGLMLLALASIYLLLPHQNELNAENSSLTG
jgi:hypothetical protein